MTTQTGFQVHTHLRVLEFKKEEPVRYEPTRKEIWQGLAVGTLCMAIACVLTYLMYRTGMAVWHGLVALESKLEQLI